jgi:hypothetical protein
MASRTEQQERLGIVDSPQDHAVDVEAICHDMGVTDDPVMRQHFVENVAASVDFLRELGVNFMDPLVLPPNRKARQHQVIPDFAGLCRLALQALPESRCEDRPEYACN